MRRPALRLTGRSVLPRSDRGVLVALLIAGGLLRLAMLLAIRPIKYGNNDSGTYLAAASGAGGSVFYDVHHAVGYSIYLDVVAPVVQSGTGLAILQHLLGLAAGALLFLAARNFGAPRWAAAIGGAAYLLNMDIAILEHSILSEAVYLPLIALFVFAASRLYLARGLKGIVASAAVLGLAGALAYTVRYPGAALFAIAVPVALVLARGGVRPRAFAGLSAAVAIAVVLASYLAAQDAATGIGWSLFPGRGWNAYATIAPSVDCSRFTPPPGTQVLCQPPREREGKTAEFYSWHPLSPGRRLEPRGFPYSDEKFAAFAEAASAAQDGGGGSGGGGSGGVGPLAELESKGLEVLRESGVVLGPLGWAPEVDFRNPPQEEVERGLTGDLLDLAPMSFHAPLQPLRDLRPFLRLSGPLALIVLLTVLVALPRLGLPRALFCLGCSAAAFAWIDAGTLPRYAVPVYLLIAALFPIAMAVLARPQAPPAPGGPSGETAMPARAEGSRSVATVA